MEYSIPKWIVQGPRDLEKTLRKLPKEVGRLYTSFVADLKNEGPFPKGWRIIHLQGSLKGCLRAVFIEMIADRKDAYEV